jgi:hypothetical protein
MIFYEVYVPYESLKKCYGCAAIFERQKIKINYTLFIKY